MLELGCSHATNVPEGKLKIGEVFTFDAVDHDWQPVFGQLAMKLDESHPVHHNGKDGKNGIEGDVLLGTLEPKSAKTIATSPRARNIGNGPIFAAIWRNDGDSTHEVQFYRHRKNFRELTSRR